MSQRTIMPCVLCGRDTIIDERPSVCFDCQEKDSSAQDMRTGREWRENSSLEKWFPLTALELAGLRPRYKQLYELVEAYLCTPNTEPVIEDHYKALVAWFVRNKRPDGTEPRPVSPEQTLL